MSLMWILLPSLFLLAFSSESASVLPQLETFGSKWLPAYDPPTRALPVIGNFRGGVGVSRTDVAGFDSFDSAPFAQGMSSMVSLSIDGAKCNVTHHRWKPYEVVRIADGGDLPSRLSAVHSRLRMPLMRSEVLLNISIFGTGTHRLALSLSPRVRAYDCIDGWGCTANPAWCSLPSSDVQAVKCASVNDFRYSVSGNIFVSTDRHSSASTSILVGTSAGTIEPNLKSDGSGGVVAANLSLPAWITVAVTVAETPDVAVETAIRRFGNAETFAQSWIAAEEQWSERWRDNFDASSSSGQLPVLETADADLAKVYYTSALTLLTLSREGPGYPSRTWATSHAAATTGECGGNQYFWDTSFHAVATTLMDPLAMREAILATLRTNILDNNWLCLQSGCGAPGSSKYKKQCFNMIGKYAFNAGAVFTTIETYLRTTGDIGFLQVEVAEHTVDEWLDRIASDWQKHPSKASPLLTDYGEDPNEYLECVSTYVGAVAAIQAHTVDMLRRLAELREHQGNFSSAAQLRITAASVATEVHQRLYNSGKGFWSSIYANGTVTPVRHCLDFINVGRHMASDLPAKTRAEMVNFASSELVYHGGAWIRALSLQDSAQGALRPDHGKWGAYAAWPPLVAEAFAELASGFNHTLEILRGAAAVAEQGPFGQATQLRPSEGAPGAGPPFKTMYGCTMYAADAGGAWVDAVVRTLFGFRPRWGASNLQEMLWYPNMSRGTFQGTLRGVRTPLGLADITAGSEGLSITPSSSAGQRTTGAARFIV